MFSNIGKKIKSLAEILCWIGIVISIIAAIVLLVVTQSSFGPAEALRFIIIFIGGPLLSWISSFILYGFGELIDKTCEIARNTENGEFKSKYIKKSDVKQTEEIERLRSQGLISEEE